MGKCIYFEGQGGALLDFSKGHVWVSQGDLCWIYTYRTVR